MDIWFQPIPDGQAVRLTKDPGEDGFPNVSPDGKQVAFRSERAGGGIYVIRSDGTGETLLVPLGMSPAFSPDGKSLAYWVGTEASQTGGSSYIYRLDSGRSERIAPDFSDARYPTWSADGRSLLLYGCGPTMSKDTCPEWWVVSSQGGAPAPVGLLAYLQKEKIGPDFPPEVSWRGNHFFVAGRSGNSWGLWDVPTVGPPLHAAGHPVALTKSELQEKAPTVDDHGGIGLEHLTGARHVWRFAATPANHNETAVKLTDDFGPDSSPVVSKDGKWVYFSRRTSGAAQLMKLELRSGKESVIYTSADDELWPLPVSAGNEIVYESRLGDQTSLVLFKDNAVRTLCNGCSHPGAWITEGKELVYLTQNGSIAVLNLDTGVSTTVIAASSQYTLANPDWNPANQHLLFTAIRGGSPEIVAARLTKGPGYTVSAWTALSSKSEDSDLGRWSDDGLHYYYFSRRDGSYCVWGNSFDSRRHTVGTPFPVEHYHDWGKSPRMAFAFSRGLSVADGWIYVNVGESASTIWVGHLEINPVFTFLQKLFR